MSGKVISTNLTVNSTYGLVRPRFQADRRSAPGAELGTDQWALVEPVS
jgi:hypothetical protein